MCVRVCMWCCSVLPCFCLSLFLSLSLYIYIYTYIYIYIGVRNIMIITMQNGPGDLSSNLVRPCLNLT